MPKTTNNINAALYMRVSNDDESFNDSISIETQRKLLRKFAHENGFIIVDEYVDDGWSGTDFERPNFQRMSKDIDAGRVNCVIVKDLSRFGREYLTMGNLLEKEYPRKGVRFIAVTENEDSDKGLSKLVVIKNVFNDFFASDTSEKIKAALRAKHAAGEHICAYAPLGYKKDPNIKNHLIIDDETKWIIEKIFDYAYHGAGAAKIAKTLFTEKVPTSGWLKYKSSGGFAKYYEGQPDDKAYAWTISQVKSILKDEVYIGNSIHYRQIVESYKTKQLKRQKSDEWLRVENTHEPIIDKRVFEQVQQQIENRRRQQKDGTTQIFAGLVRCADCRWSMSFATNTQNKKPYSYFNCTSYRQFGKNGGTCSQHYIRYDVLYGFVLSRIQYWTAKLADDKDSMIKRIRKLAEIDSMSTKKSKQTELNRSKKRKDEVDRLFSRVYEDWVAQRITDYNFKMLSEKYQAEQVALEEKISRLTDELAQAQLREDSAQKWTEVLSKYVNPTELTSEMLNELIEKILVHEAVKHEDGSKTQKIEICYRFVGNIE